MKAKFLIPLGLFVVLVGFLAVGLGLDPREVPSPLVNKPAPLFKLTQLEQPELQFAPEELKGKVWLFNVWASWCVACREEHPVLMGLAARGKVPLHGLNYKDRPDDAARWLNTMGDPYTRTGADLDGRVAIDWGVYGVPETYVVGADGRIAHKHIGAVTREALDTTILPLVEKLQAASREQQG